MDFSGKRPVEKNVNCKVVDALLFIAETYGADTSIEKYEDKIRFVPNTMTKSWLYLGVDGSVETRYDKPTYLVMGKGIASLVNSIHEYVGDVRYSGDCTINSHWLDFHEDWVSSRECYDTLRDFCQRHGVEYGE